MKPKQLWYHGGPKINNWSDIKWDRDRSTSSLNDQGPGMYRTTDIDEANNYRYDGVMYTAEMRSDFRLLPKKRPTMKALRELYGYASEESQLIFLSNWDIEFPATKLELDSALKHYSHQDSLFDAFSTLYHDLYLYNADEYVSSLRAMDFDGFVISIGFSMSNTLAKAKGLRHGWQSRKHLILWNPKALEIIDIE